MNLKGTKTEKNLLAAFAGESQASTKYRYYASQAKKEGYVQIQNIFTETADNEKEHAKLWFKALHDGGIPNTLQNLADAAAGENYEHTEMYKEFAETAKEEGFDSLAVLFELVGKIEADHETRYRKLADAVKNGTVFTKDKSCCENVVKWKCLNCGHVHAGSTALEMCPTCAHPKAFFELFCENY